MKVLNRYKKTGTGAFIYEENRITAYFTDNAYYHIVNIQGSDANEETAINIIENLEDR